MAVPAQDCARDDLTMADTVAWTLADLAGRDRPDEELVSTALIFPDRRAA
jgi:hypothetical protein